MPLPNLVALALFLVLCMVIALVLLLIEVLGWWCKLVAWWRKK